MSKTIQPTGKLTVVKILVEDREKLREIASATGMHMYRTLGDMIDKEWRKLKK
jgi:hypothetical protein